MCRVFLFWAETVKLNGGFGCVEDEERKKINIILWFCAAPSAPEVTVVRIEDMCYVCDSLRS